MANPEHLKILKKGVKAWNSGGSTLCVGLSRCDKVLRKTVKELEENIKDTYMLITTADVPKEHNIKRIPI